MSTQERLPLHNKRWERDCAPPVHLHSSMEEESMRSTLLFAGLLAATLSTPVLAQTGSTMASGTALVGDATFVEKVAISDMYEIQASQLAQTKATSADVKSFA